jgi:Na+/melibiose symporter-like transporter
MLIFGFLSAVPGSFNSVAHTAMLGNTVEYLEMKTGKRTEGLTFSVLTFMGKIGNGVSQGGALVLIALIGIDLTLDPNADKGLQQSDHVLNSIFLWLCLSPALASLVNAVIFMFYKFDDKKHAEALKIIAERKAAESAGA